jgi:polyferredoxin
MIKLEERINIQRKTSYRKKIQFLMLLLIFIFIDIGWYYPLIGVFIPIFFIFMLVISFYKGRLCCGWLCPRGSLLEIIVKKITLRYKRPQIFKEGKYKKRFLILFFSLFTYFFFTTTYGYKGLVNLGEFFIYYYLLSTILAIVLGILFGERSYCLICPEGVLFSFFSEGKVIMDLDESCIKCGYCEEVCPLSLKIGKDTYRGKRTIENKYCIKCYLCLEKCPMHALSFK